MCTPYPAGPNYVQGGIAIWAKSITDYAEALAGGADLHVVPFNRVSFGLERVNMIRRAWRGILEYLSESFS